MPRARSPLAASLLLGTLSVVTNAAAATPPCGGPATPIHELHRGGLDPGAVFTVEAVVTGDHQGTQGLSGFFVQEQDADQDDDAATPEGLFVRDAALETAVEVGDLVRVEGVLDAAARTSTLVPTQPVTVCTKRVSVSATELELPLAALTEPKALEGMLIRVPGPLVVTALGDLHRHGEVVLSWGDRLYQPTQVAAPGERAREVEAWNALGQLRVDDGSSLTPGTDGLHASAQGPLRAGDELDALVGVLVRDGTGFEVQPPGPLVFRAANPRPAAPEDPGGTLRVAGFNVKNYFATLADGSARCGPRQNLDCRGAKDATERLWQRAKVAAVVRGLAADLLALVEVENDDGRATRELAADASSGELVYDWVDSGPLGSDAIRVALLYRPDRVAPRGDFAVLDRSVEPSFDDLAHRPVLAQTFEELSSGERLTVAVHHLKSKGSPCQDDPALDDGQGACNATRTRAAAAEAAWLLDDPTASGDPDLLVLGDLNAYGAEAPVNAFLAAGYRDLTEEALGARAYSYAFEGRFGLLDPVFASPALEPQVAGVALWHVNADEAAEAGAPPAAFDGEWNVDPFRASDHDPVLVGLRLAPAVEGTATGLHAPDASVPKDAASPSDQGTPDASDAEPSPAPPEASPPPTGSAGCSFTERHPRRCGWAVLLLSCGWGLRRARVSRRLP